MIEFIDTNESRILICNPFYHADTLRQTTRSKKWNISEIVKDGPRIRKRHNRNVAPDEPDKSKSHCGKGKQVISCLVCLKEVVLREIR